MARSKIIQAGQADAFRYSPGDGRTYTWDGSSEYATVWKHNRSDGALVGNTVEWTPALGMERTTEAVDVTGCARTATAFMDVIDRWRLR